MVIPERIKGGLVINPCCHRTPGLCRDPKSHRGSPRCPRGELMPAFAALDKRLRSDEQSLHDFLWHDWKGDPSVLLGSVVRDARALDAFLGARGKLGGSAAALAKRVQAQGKEGAGEGLYELVSHAYQLTAATVHLGKEDADGAADHLEDVMGSVTIGVCSNAGCCQYVPEWESKRIDFE